jgi:hypothetical protein
MSKSWEGSPCHLARTRIYGCPVGSVVQLWVKCPAVALTLATKIQLPPVLGLYSRMTGTLVVSTVLPVGLVNVPEIVVFPPVGRTIAGVTWAVIVGWSGYFSE